MNFKACGTCKEQLPLNDEFFYRNRGILWTQRCKRCMKKYVSDWREAKKQKTELIDRTKARTRPEIQEIIDFAKARGINVRIEVK